MTKIKIDPAKIGAVIGTGGKTIRAIIEQTKASVDVSDDGTVVIGSNDMDSTQKAIAMIEGLTREPRIGEVFTGKVSRIFEFGAMVEILPGKEGMVHISELADFRVGKVEDVVKIGDEVMVKVINVDEKGRINLSRRALFEKEGQSSEAAGEGAPSADYPFRKSSSGGDRHPRQGGSRPPFKRN
jgi:polyribonucleotide nucleotidyltransferase